MAISTGEIVFICFLLIGLATAILYVYVAVQYSRTISESTYTRGANYDPGQKNTSGTINFTCDKDRHIVITDAHVVWTGRLANNDFNTEVYDMYNYGIGKGDGQYGTFIKDTRCKDELQKLINKHEDRSNFSLEYSGGRYTGLTTPEQPNIGNTSSNRPQLIATYSCVPKHKLTEVEFDEE